jgi:hypothetical protein
MFCRAFELAARSGGRSATGGYNSTLTGRAMPMPYSRASSFRNFSISAM